MTPYRLEIKLTLVGPILTKATVASDRGVDAHSARDASSEMYIIPGTLLEGNLSEAWQEIEQLQEAGGILAGIRSLLLGEESKKGGYEPRRGRLTVGDLRLDAAAHPVPNVRNRIRIDQERGAAVRGALQAMECPFEVGQEYVFVGFATLLVDNEAKASEVAEWVDRGLRWVTHLGSCKSIGFGRIRSVVVSLQERKSPRAEMVSDSNFDGDRFGIALEPTSPFCFAGKRTTDNLFESEEYIPGGAIKGALATMIEVDNGGDERLLMDNLDKIRFTHAFPSPVSEASGNSSKRPVHPPLSLVKFGCELRDIALCEHPVLVNGQAPSFSVDWKSGDDVLSAFGWPNLKKDMRVRTAICFETRRAKEEQLFAYETIVPDGCQWLGTVDLSHVPASDRKNVSRCLQTHLAGGLAFLGKTKAEAEVTVGTDYGSAIPSDMNCLRQDGRPFWAITLQTSALLCNPQWESDLDPVDPGWLLSAYGDSFADLSSKKLKLIRLFAEQELAGGYLRQRFQKPESEYYPYLLTKAGSVFVFTCSDGVTEEAAMEIVAGWIRNGLKLPTWAESMYGSSWKECPFLPENGFGEVAVNLSWSHKQPPTVILPGGN